MFTAQPGYPRPPPPPPPPPPPHSRGRWSWISPHRFGIATASRLWQRRRRRPRRFRRSCHARHRRHTVELSLPAAERSGGAVSGSIAPGQRHCCAARLGGAAAPRRGCGRCCGASEGGRRFAPSPLTAATSAFPLRGGSPTAAPPQRRGRRPATEAEGATAAHRHRHRRRRPRWWRHRLRLVQSRAQCGPSHSGSRSWSPRYSGVGPRAPAARHRRSGGASGLGWCARSPGSRAASAQRARSSAPPAPRR